MRDEVVSEDPFELKDCRDRYKTQQMCNKAGDDLLLLKAKWWKKIITALYADNNIICFNEDHGNAVFSCNEMGIITIDLNNINLDDTDNNDDDFKNTIQMRLLAWHIKF